MSEPNYDDIVTFARVLNVTAFMYDDDQERLFEYFEAPHKWGAEYAKWRELGGTMELDCINAFEEWYDTTR